MRRHHHYLHTPHLILTPLVSIYRLITSLFGVTQQQDSGVVLFVTKENEELCIHNGGINSSSCSAHPVLLFFNYLASFVPILLWCFVQTFVIFVKNFQRKYFTKRKSHWNVGWAATFSFLISKDVKPDSHSIWPALPLFVSSNSSSFYVIIYPLLVCSSRSLFHSAQCHSVTIGTQDQDEKYHCTATGRNSNN